MIEKNEIILKMNIDQEIHLTKEILKEMIVIDQFDLKFIITKYKTFLYSQKL